MDRPTRLKIFKKMLYCRAFENKVYQKIQEKAFTHGAFYLSAGEEVVPATLSAWCENNNLHPDIFAQHRCHSTYLSFGGSPEKLRDELLGLETGCANGMGGSASIHSPEIKMWGHDGLLGSQVPIACGYAHATKKFTISILGDAAAEEDYVLASFGYAKTKNLPMLFIVEDNNLSVLTEKKVRRSWDIVEVAKGFGLEARNISDDPVEIMEALDNLYNKRPALIRINICRLYWHAGAGTDHNPEGWDRLKLEAEALGVSKDYEDTFKSQMDELWENH